MRKRILEMKRKKFTSPLLIFSLLILMFSCRNENRQEDEDQMQEMSSDTTATTPVETQTFAGDINADANDEVSGTVQLTVQGDLLRVVVTAEGLGKEMMHMQYLQTSETGEEISCSEATTGTNNEGMVNMDEVSANENGIQRIPLHMGPSSLEMNVDTYPVTNINGELQFQRTVSLDSLRNAVRTEYGMQDLDFSRFTYVIQGVSGTSNQSDSVESGSGLPRNGNVPIGCAQLEEE